MMERKQIVDLVSANAKTLTANLNNYWTRSVQDMAEGGVPLGELAESLFTVALTYKLLAEGKAATVKHLRGLADYIDRNLPDQDAPASNAGRRH